MSLSRTFDVATATVASAARPNFGNVHVARRAEPAQTLELFDFEACPFCRKAREALSALSLSAIVYPCPKNGPTYRRQVIERTGKSQFPYLVDPNNDVAMFESDDIVRYVFKQYGTGAPPWYFSSVFATVTSSLASAARPNSGRTYAPARKPEERLELYGYEGSPFCRIAREALCELEIPYLLHNVPRKSPGRAGFIERSGRMQVPYLVDPNTDTAMFESAEIARYLYDTYAR